MTFRLVSMQMEATLLLCDCSFAASFTATQRVITPIAGDFSLTWLESGFVRRGTVDFLQGTNFGPSRSRKASDNPRHSLDILQPLPRYTLVDTKLPEVSLHEPRLPGPIDSGNQLPTRMRTTLYREWECLCVRKKSTSTVPHRSLGASFRHTTSFVTIH